MSIPIDQTTEQLQTQATQVLISMSRHRILRLVLSYLFSLNPDEPTTPQYQKFQLALLALLGKDFWLINDYGVYKEWLLKHETLVAPLFSRIDEFRERPRDKWFYEHILARLSKESEPYWLEQQLKKVSTSLATLDADIQTEWRLLASSSETLQIRPITDFVSLTKNADDSWSASINQQVLSDLNKLIPSSLEEFVSLWFNKGDAVLQRENFFAQIKSSPGQVERELETAALSVVSAPAGDHPTVSAIVPISERSLSRILAQVKPLPEEIQIEQLADDLSQQPSEEEAHRDKILISLSRYRILRLALSYFFPSDPKFNDELSEHERAKLKVYLMALLGPSFWAIDSYAGYKSWLSDHAERARIISKTGVSYEVGVRDLRKGYWLYHQISDDEIDTELSWLDSQRISSDAALNASIQAEWKSLATPVAATDKMLAMRPLTDFIAITEEANGSSSVSVHEKTLADLTELSAFCLKEFARPRNRPVFPDQINNFSKQIKNAPERISLALATAGLSAAQASSGNYSIVFDDTDCCWQSRPILSYWKTARNSITTAFSGPPEAGEIVYNAHVSDKMRNSNMSTPAERTAEQLKNDRMLISLSRYDILRIVLSYLVPTVPNADPTDEAQDFKQALLALLAPEFWAITTYGEYRKWLADHKPNIYLAMPKSLSFSQSITDLSNPTPTKSLSREEWFYNKLFSELDAEHHEIDVFAWAKQIEDNSNEFKFSDLQDGAQKDWRALEERTIDKTGIGLEIRPITDFARLLQQDDLQPDISMPAYAVLTNTYSDLNARIYSELKTAGLYASKANQNNYIAFNDVTNAWAVDPNHPIDNAPQPSASIEQIPEAEKQGTLIELSRYRLLRYALNYFDKKKEEPDAEVLKFQALLLELFQPGFWSIDNYDVYLAWLDNYHDRMNHIADSITCILENNFVSMIVRSPTREEDFANTTSENLAKAQKRLPISHESPRERGLSWHDRAITESCPLYLPSDIVSYPSGEAKVRIKTLNHFWNTDTRELSQTSKNALQKLANQCGKSFDESFLVGKLENIEKYLEARRQYLAANSLFARWATPVKRWFKAYWPYLAVGAAAIGVEALFGMLPEIFLAWALPGMTAVIAAIGHVLALATPVLPIIGLAVATLVAGLLVGQMLGRTVRAVRESYSGLVLTGVWSIFSTLKNLSPTSSSSVEPRSALGQRVHSFFSNAWESCKSHPIRTLTVLALIAATIVAVALGPTILALPAIAALSANCAALAATASTALVPSASAVIGISAVLAGVLAGCITAAMISVGFKVAQVDSSPVSAADAKGTGTYAKLPFGSAVDPQPEASPSPMYKPPVGFTQQGAAGSIEQPPKPVVPGYSPVVSAS